MMRTAKIQLLQSQDHFYFKYLWIYQLKILYYLGVVPYKAVLTEFSNDVVLKERSVIFKVIHHYINC